MECLLPVSQQESEECPNEHYADSRKTSCDCVECKEFFQKFFATPPAEVEWDRETSSDESETTDLTGSEINEVRTLDEVLAEEENENLLEEDSGDGMIQDIINFDKENTNPKWVWSNGSFIMMIVGLFLFFTVIGAEIRIIPKSEIVAEGQSIQLHCRDENGSAGVFLWEHHAFGKTRVYWDTVGLTQSVLYIRNFSIANQGLYYCGLWQKDRMDKWGKSTLQMEIPPEDCNCGKVHIKNTKLTIFCEMDNFRSTALPEWWWNDKKIPWEGSFSYNPKLAPQGK